MSATIPTTAHPALHAGRARPPTDWSRLPRLVTSPRAARLTFPLVLLALWQVFGPLLESRILPTPAEVGEEMWELLREGTAYDAFSVSLLRLGAGFAWALVIGTVVGLAMGLSSRVEALLHDFVIVGLTFPYLIWGLLVAMWVGFDGRGPIIVVAIAAAPYVIINVAEGVRDVPKELRDMASAYGVARGPAVRHVIVPSLSPFLFASLRYGLANGWKGLVLAEVFSATSGAGYQIAEFRDYGNFAGVVAFALYFALFSILVERLVFGRLSQWVFRWRPALAGAGAVAEPPPPIWPATSAASPGSAESAGSAAPATSLTPATPPAPEEA